MKKGVTFCEVGEQFSDFLLIKSSTRGVASNGKPFLTLMLQDKSGEIEAKLWDTGAEEEKTYHAENIVKVLGEVTNYRGRQQLKIKKIRPATPQDGVSVTDFLETAPQSKDELLDEITSYIFDMKNPHLQRITRHLVKKHQQAFLEYPAATKNHHEFVSGLAYHVVHMLRLAKAISGIYPSLNTDLLYSGVILHDLGKTTELSGPVSTTYTVEGNLLGHISLMANEIAQTALELDIQAEEVTLLQHLVLSHHSKGEWGSPKPPMLREAEILHYIDNIDARMNIMDRALERTKPGEFTERLFPMENRKFYKPSTENES
ncbi:3'-5' exoribonuclease YhaM [Bacillaceae bacterium SIJ1]|uniref:3'-5' exoribonuclease YhaM n=1 Tax=Litoribacterium kuwaitense TaxID=1398745 RepID=UPI0013EBFABA|nr:3'-5' exoribonuclease YhaM [Litoribacterium kuwaitense]NGP43900.1 3'-5' exoribonuclease YhaM [Litoribacterium kuwaitense]